MKAAYLEHNKVVVGDMPDPKPEKGQVLVRTHRCGLCASDVHFVKSAHQMVARDKEFGGPRFSDQMERRLSRQQISGEVVSDLGHL